MNISIAGGGMVGLLAANLLIKAGFDVGISEPHPPGPFDFEQALDLRVSVLTPVSVKILQHLECWEALLQHQNRIGYFNQMKVWEENVEKALIFDGQKIAQQPLGYVIENNLLRKILWDKYIKYINTKINLKAEIYNKNMPSLTIAADGANSSLRQSAGIECDTKMYDQQAIVAVVQVEKSHQNKAFQRFIGSASLAFLPLPDPHHCSIVWSQSPSNAAELLQCDKVSFNQALQRAFGDELGELTLVGDRLKFLLKKQHAKHYIQPRFVLIGDAAHVIHPLAGFGVNMGFLDVVYLVKVLTQARKEGRDIGSYHCLRKYERARKSENVFMLNVVDCFTKPGLRKIGLNLTYHLEFLQKFFMRWMSVHGDKNIFV